jgi:hypothetical protein
MAVMEDFTCEHCSKPFKDWPCTKRKFCSLRCSQSAQRAARTTTTPEYRRLRKIWGEMKRYAAKEIGPGIVNAEIDVGWQASFFIFQRWASNAGYQPGMRFRRKDKRLGYTPDNCEFTTCSS